MHCTELCCVRLFCDSQSCKTMFVFMSSGHLQHLIVVACPNFPMQRLPGRNVFCSSCSDIAETCHLQTSGKETKCLHQTLRNTQKPTSRHMMREDRSKLKQRRSKQQRQRHTVEISTQLFNMDSSHKASYVSKSGLAPQHRPSPDHAPRFTHS